MHIYIYDSFVNQKKYESTMARVETRITDLGLNGKIIRLGLMNSVYDAVENEIKKGAKTIIAVGNNFLLNQVVNAMAKLTAGHILNKTTPLGFIPIGKANNDIADYLGIDLDEEAGNILSARRIQKLDLGLANNYYFLSQATITSQGTTVEIDKNYSIEIMGSGKIGVINLPITNDLPANIRPDAKDGILELFIKTRNLKKFLPLSPKKTESSIFSFKKLRIINKHQPLIVDGSVKIPTPVDISIAQEKINIIVGKKRKF
jgi:diacylglycerol kinase family enzyme